jgi:hypothetical protein
MKSYQKLLDFTLSIIYVIYPNHNEPEEFSWCGDQATCRTTEQPWLYSRENKFPLLQRAKNVCRKFSKEVKTLGCKADHSKSSTETKNE